MQAARLDSHLESSSFPSETRSPILLEDPTVVQDILLTGSLKHAVIIRRTQDYHRKYETYTAETITSSLTPQLLSTDDYTMSRIMNIFRRDAGQPVGINHTMLNLLVVLLVLVLLTHSCSWRRCCSCARDGELAGRRCYHCTTKSASRPRPRALTTVAS